MNRIMREYYHGFAMYQSLRNQLMEIVTNADLAYTPGGSNTTLGALCKEIGETEYAYIQSFKTWQIDFSYRNNISGLENNLSALTTWFGELDWELKATLENLSDDDLNNRLVDRGGDFKLPAHIQLFVYQEALLIFYGKVSVYLKAMGKERPNQWQDWIG